MAESHPKLRVFLCHAPGDRPVVREMYHRLSAEEWIHPLLDEGPLPPDQDWRSEIEKAVQAADAMIAFLSERSVSREGFPQRRLRYALDVALKRPAGTIAIIPLRLEKCRLPRELQDFQLLDFFPEPHGASAYQLLLSSLRTRAGSISMGEHEEH